MPDRQTMQEAHVKRRAQKDKAQGKSPSTQAGEFVREEVHHVREGKHGARSPKQVIAIGLSKARRAGVGLAPPAKGTTSARTRRSAKLDSARGRPSGSKPASAKRSRATKRALKREGRAAGTHRALSRHARAASARRGATKRAASAKKAARTKGAIGRKTMGTKGHPTRAAHR